MMANNQPRCIVDVCTKSAPRASLVIAPDEIIVRYAVGALARAGEQSIGPLCDTHADELAQDVLTGGPELHRWRLTQQLGKPERVMLAPHPVDYLEGETF